jgi:hypothetical protein
MGLKVIPIGSSQEIDPSRIKALRRIHFLLQCLNGCSWLENFNMIDAKFDHRLSNETNPKSVLRV